MSYITGDLSLEKGVASQLFFDKDAFIAATTFSDLYFQNYLNWDRVVIYYTDQTEQQEEPVIIKPNFSQGKFLLSIFSRSGSWTVNRIEIYDREGDHYTVSRAEIPNAGDTDLEIVRVLCPESDVDSVSAVDKVTLVAGESQYYEIGFFVKLWDVDAIDYLGPEVYEIINIDVEELTFDISINIAHLGKTLQVVYARFDDASVKQKDNYVYLDSGF